MSAGSGGGARARALRRHYRETDLLLSADGLLKLLAIVVCGAVVALQVTAGGARCGALVWAALAAGGGTALVVAARALRLAHATPEAFLLLEAVWSGAGGAGLLLSAALRLALCAPATATHYLTPALELLAAGCLSASASLAYGGAMRALDAARAPPPPAPPQTPAPPEWNV